MGQAASRESGNKVYAGRSPVSVSSGLEKELDKSPDSDFTRQQLTAKQIDDLVAERLYNARVEAEGRLKDAANRIESELPPTEADAESGLSSASLRKQLEAMTEALEKQPKHGKLDASGEKARETLVACFRKNKGRPLDCREEFESFKQEVRALEKRLN